jgi:hypothetical protein
MLHRRSRLSDPGFHAPRACDCSAAAEARSADRSDPADARPTGC